MHLTIVHPILAHPHNYKKPKYMENIWSFKLRINITESSHMAELNGEFSVTELLWLMTGRGCNSNTIMVSTGD